MLTQAELERLKELHGKATQLYAESRNALPALLEELQSRRKADAVVPVLSDAHRSWCGNCQETIRGEWKFCPECGKRLDR